jgi:hypothetical protein
MKGKKMTAKTKFTPVTPAMPSEEKHMAISHMAIDMKGLSHFVENDTLFLAIPAEEIILSGTMADLDALGFNPAEKDELLDEFFFHVRRFQTLKILKERMR